MGFSFKAFHVDDFGCGMPVSTDAVLLGAWANLYGAETVLDLGAGSGLLALMAAQRCNAPITAIEIDPVAANACRANIAASPWPDRITLIEADATDTTVLAGKVFTHILCNPPYFETGPLSEKPGRALARHTGSLGFSVLCHLIAAHLRADGLASLVLPVESEVTFRQALTHAGLGIRQRVEVSTVEGKPPRRLLLALGQGDGPCENESLAIRDIHGCYTEAMTALTRDFYLKL
ncbi:tRNA1(Val) (adenine(37)-N6)-methyltransferase [Shewanella litorisediminis]|uniref:tRNA1(Val) (adenine(37)-N6)-methyltransferase n=1 Tax=Shewanella litorisediminis TaxID=1173586 RepID=A0ABX7G123_9GAMM|nr:methyltransferase [Shewanella litorisediminis]MCL2918934.1 methyltransferase [Shewanella litorisediminis]QRH01004.1 methyltransferase [Shewanella litorisediminis]